jgi:hypothetical protein
VFREIINTMETQKEYFVQEYIIQGITHTRTIIYGRDVLNKGRFVLAPSFLLWGGGGAGKNARVAKKHVLLYLFLSARNG